MHSGITIYLFIYLNNICANPTEKNKICHTASHHRKPKYMYMNKICIRRIMYEHPNVARFNVKNFCKLYDFSPLTFCFKKHQKLFASLIQGLSENRNIAYQKNSCQAKVSHLAHIVISHQNIPCCQISVNVVLQLQVRHASGHLCPHTYLIRKTKTSASVFCIKEKLLK